MRSQYGNWESRGEVVDGALWTVANVHHILATPRNGYACICGAKPITARGATEHIMDRAMDALVTSGVALNTQEGS